MSPATDKLPMLSTSGGVEVVHTHNGRSNISTFTTKHKKPLFIILSSLLLVAVVAAAVATTVARRNGEEKEGGNVASFTASHAVLRSSCSSTLYPELCFSTIAANPSLAAGISTQKDVIEAALNLTTLAVEHAYFNIKRIEKKRKGLTAREKVALHDCLENIDETLDELRTSYDDLKAYPSSKKNISEQADDLKTLLSATITNQESCLDGFSHDKADKKVRTVLEKSFDHVEKMCSNALAMICNMTNTDIALEREKLAGGRKLVEERPEDLLDEDGFPKWLSAGDRRLLQASTVRPDVVVAADGSGDHKTVSAAVAAAPDRSNKRFVIHIKAGVYRESVDIPKKKTNIMFIGDGRRTTIITASKNVVDGSTTFNSATVGEYFSSSSSIVSSLIFFIS